MSQQQKRIITAVCLLHVLVLLIFYFYITSNAVSPSDRVWYWMIWFLIDFPVTSLLMVLAMANASVGVFGASSIDGFFFFFHLTVGTAWWGFITHLIYDRFFNKKSKVNRNKLQDRSVFYSDLISQHYLF